MAIAIDKPSKYFNTILYTGTETTTNVTGVGFNPDWVWIKSRSDAYNNNVWDRVRGAGQRLITNATDAEETSTGDMSAFVTDGFTVGGGWITNKSGRNYVAWNWLAGGTGVSNTSGTISSTVSANTTSGFSIVSYTGTGTTSKTVGHGLGVTPAMIIIKNRSASPTSWRVYHKSLAVNGSYPNFLELDTTSASQTGDSGNFASVPTSSVFGVGNYNVVNGNGNSMIAYCFAEVKGFSKAFSYTGNGNANGTFVYCGFRPAYIMLKCTSTASTQWSVYDVKRDTKNYVSLNLYPSGSNAENDMFNGTDGVCDFVSNGFKFRDTYGWHNASGSTYVGFAIAENPFVSSKGIPCTAR